MTTVQDILTFLEGFTPPELAESWDNVGLLCGDRMQEVLNVLCALDVTETVVTEAAEKGAQLIVAHHPAIFTSVSRVTEDDATGRILRLAIKHDIALICMHTNADCAEGGVNDALAAALGLEDPGPLEGTDGICRVGHLLSPMPFQVFAQHVCRCLRANGVRYAGAEGPVQKIAVGGGACADYADAAIAAGCDVFVTSDLSYHEFLDAEGKGIRLIDAGHFPTEDPVCAVLVEYLRGQFPGLDVSKSVSHREVIQYYVEGE